MAEKIKSKLFNLLLITTFILPTVFFQNSCSKKNDDKIEKKIYELNEKIKNLEKIKDDLSSQLKPFNDLMKKHAVNNFDDLMQKLTNLDDPNLQKSALLLANCLLETKTMTWEKLQEKLDDKRWKDQNKKKLESLCKLFGIGKVEKLTSTSISNNKIKDLNKIKTLAEKIAEINDSDFIKHIGKEIIENKNKLISFYLSQLWDDSCHNWDFFVAKFNNAEWKNNEKNQPIIDALSSLLNCSSEDINGEKINGLDEQTRNNILDLIKDKVEILKKLAGLNQDNEGLQKQLEENKKKLIAFELSKLWDDSCSSWESFVAKFNDIEWKINEKNQPIIAALTSLLNCSSKDINGEKINGLEEQTRNTILDLTKHKVEMFEKLTGLNQDNEGLQKQLEENKKKLIAFELSKLWDDSCINWDSFVAKFNDAEWKNNEKNQPIIDALVSVLNCSSEDINGDKINSLDQETQNIISNLVNDKIEMFKKMTGLNQDNEELKKQNKEKELQIDELMSKIKKLEKDKKEKLDQSLKKMEQLEEYRKNLIAFCLPQLWDESCVDWDSFVAKFNDAEWKNNKKNRQIINTLSNLLCCSRNEINSDVINDLGKEAMDLLNGNMIIDKQLSELRESKNKLISFYLSQLWDDSYPNWDYFVTKFNDVEWKNNEKNQPIIAALASLLNCSSDEIDSNKINSGKNSNLDHEIINDIKDLQKITKESIEFNDIKMKLILFYLVQIWDEGCINWDSFAKKFDDDNWKNNVKNKPVIDAISILLNCTNDEINAKKINNLNHKTKTNITNLSDVTWKIFKLIKNRKKLITFYLVQLWDENCTNWDSFAKKFDDDNWTNNEKNKAIINVLDVLLNCSCNDNNKINNKKINESLDNATKTDIVNLSYSKLEIGKGLHELWEYKDKLISFYLSQLWDDSCTDWNTFATKFNSAEWKNNEKNKPIIDVIVNLLNCTNNKINNSSEINDIVITHLSSEIIDKTKELLYRELETTKQLNKSEENKKELISLYLSQLWNENYGDWDVFAKKFDDQGWKNNEKNKPIIDTLSALLNCTNDKINSDKINKIDISSKDIIKNLGKCRQEAVKLKENKIKFIPFYLSQLWDESCSNWDSFVVKFNNTEWKNDEKNRPIIAALASFFNCSSEDINSKKINSLSDKIVSHTKDMLNIKLGINKQLFKLIENSEKLLPFYLAQLLDENYYTNWNDFIEKLNEDDWKNDEKNKLIIDILTCLLKCSKKEINGSKINGLNKKIIKDTKDLFYEKIKISKLIANKMILIPFYLIQLWDKSCDNWDSFVAKFDDEKWKNDGKNRRIIDNLSYLLGYSNDEMKSDKIGGLDKEIIKNTTNLFLLHSELKTHKSKKNEMQLITFYLAQLLDDSCTNWEAFAAKFNNNEWKNDKKNQPIIDALVGLLNCSSKDINREKINGLDKEIIKNTKYLLYGKLETSKLVVNKKRLIPFYLTKLWDENYGDWNVFAKKFDDIKWKEKNKRLIKKIANYLNCSDKQINTNKINSLGRDIIGVFGGTVRDSVQSLLNDKIKISKLNLLPSPLPIINKLSNNKPFTELSHKDKKKLIILCLVWLWNKALIIYDGERDDWDSFTLLFDYRWENKFSKYSKWKEENKSIINILTSLLNCSSDEISRDKINNLGEWTKRSIQSLFHRKLEKTKQLNNLINDLNANKKKDLVVLYLSELWDDSYTNWDTFTEKFDDEMWKEKNKPIIDILASLLGYESHEINRDKIDDLDEEMIRNINDLSHSEVKITKQLEEDKKELICFYLSELWDDSYTNWDTFTEKFDDEMWKEKNKPIIDILASLLGYESHEINRELINVLDNKIIRDTQILVYSKLKKIPRKLDEIEENKKKELLILYLFLLCDDNCTIWEILVNRFDNMKWKEKNKQIIEKLAIILGCQINEINGNKINDLDEEIKKIIPALVKSKLKLVFECKPIVVWLNENNEKLIIFYLSQLWDDSCIDWDSFITKFNDEKWKNDEKNRPIITNLAHLLYCSSDEINLNKINRLNKKIKDCENRIKMIINAREIGKFLKTNNMDFEEIKQKLNELKKLHSMVKPIKLIKQLASTLLQIHKLFFVGKNMTKNEIYEKIKDDQIPIENKEMLKFLFISMEKLGVSNVNQLIEKINNWIELLNFIEGGKSTNIETLLDEMINFEEQLKKNNGIISKETIDDIVVEPNKYRQN